MLDQRHSKSPGTAASEREALAYKLAAIVESSPEAMIACTIAGRIETWNGGASNVFGYDAAQMVGHEVTDLILSGHRAEFSQLLEQAGTGQAVALFRTLGMDMNGQEIHLSVTLSPMRPDGQTITGVCMVARNVSAWRRAEEEAERGRAELGEREASLSQALTALRGSHEELKRTQLQLIQSAKLESIGRLAAGVAHEVKNPLAMILAGTEYLLTLPSKDKPPAVEPVLCDIRSAVERASTVISGLLNYSASTDLKPTEADLNAVLEQTLLLVRHALKKGSIHVEKELASGLPPLRLDVPKIEQVFINLMINAIDAMPEGGTLTIRTVRKQLTAADPSVGMRASDPFRIGESAVIVTVADTGTGIPADHQGKLFDPFFTTKPTGKGTGLGLAVSKTIVALHGGTISMSNRPEGGAIATVVLRSATA